MSVMIGDAFHFEADNSVTIIRLVTLDPGENL